MLEKWWKDPSFRSEIRRLRNQAPGQVQETIEPNYSARGTNRPTWVTPHLRKKLERGESFFGGEGEKKVRSYKGKKHRMKKKQGTPS